MAEVAGIAEARKAGYSDAEILDHVKSLGKVDGIDAALKAGHSASDVLTHISEMKAPAAEPEKPKVTADQLRGEYGEQAELVASIMNQRAPKGSELAHRSSVLPIGVTAEGKMTPALPEMITNPVQMGHEIATGQKTVRDYRGKDFLELGGLGIRPSVAMPGRMAPAAAASETPRLPAPDPARQPLAVRVSDFLDRPAANAAEFIPGVGSAIGKARAASRLAQDFMPSQRRVEQPPPSPEAPPVVEPRVPLEPPAAPGAPWGPRPTQTVPEMPLPMETTPPPVFSQPPRGVSEALMAEVKAQNRFGKQQDQQTVLAANPWIKQLAMQSKAQQRFTTQAEAALGDLAAQSRARQQAVSAEADPLLARLAQSGKFPAPAPMGRGPMGNFNGAQTPDVMPMGGAAPPMGLPKPGMPDVMWMPQGPEPLGLPAPTVRPPAPQAALPAPQPQLALPAPRPGPSSPFHGGPPGPAMPMGGPTLPARSPIVGDGLGIPDFLRRTPDPPMAPMASPVPPMAQPSPIVVTKALGKVTESTKPSRQAAEVKTRESLAEKIAARHNAEVAPAKAELPTAPEASPHYGKGNAADVIKAATDDFLKSTRIPEDRAGKSIETINRIISEKFETGKALAKEIPGFDVHDFTSRFVHARTFTGGSQLKARVKAMYPGHDAIIDQVMSDKAFSTIFKNKTSKKDGTR